MPTIAEVEKWALALPDAERARLVANLLGSLPPESRAPEVTDEEAALIDSLPGVLHDDDEGLAEANRRSAEMDADPSANLTLEQFKALVRRRFPSWG